MKINLAVLFGGRSVEHEVSVISAVQAMASINKEKYNIIPVYMTKKSEFYTSEKMLDINSFKDIPALLAESTECVFVRSEGKVQLVRQKIKKFGSNLISDVDIAFPIVHGTNVEDGALQGYLQTLDLPYVGCDVLASAVGMDKYVMKILLKEAGFPVLDCCRFSSYEIDDMDNMIAQVEAKFGYPVIVKPINLGSSVGISKAKDRDSLINSIEEAFQFADRILVEPAVVQLKEINCSVVGDSEEAEASVCEEPVQASSDEILSYDQKYKGDGGKNGSKSGGGSKGMATLKRKIPAEITPEQDEFIRRTAVDAFRYLGCNGVTRIDFMIDMATDKVYINEINTIPGSLAFYLWEPKGVKYPELLERLIQLALKRYRQSEKISYTFDTNILSMGGSFGSKGSKR
ncbi:MAG: D-alanine--D-alanine ligase family protein [Ruminococcus flavefaciens]|nr:D-alanine--D-alanine ligase family protein [Ruminococcus flavefaciens]HQL99667.1 D-alanine--D-alanine ligase family protein [Ruminococcus flavefaciens]